MNNHLLRPANGCVSTRFVVMLFLLAATLWGCDTVQPLQPQPPKGPYLSRVVEKRFTPLDSVSITSLYNPQEQLLEEQYTSQYLRRAYSLLCLYTPTNLANGQDINNEFRIYRLDDRQRVVGIKQYFSKTVNYWEVRESDSLIYQGEVLIGQLHQDFFFYADRIGYGNRYPLWVTKRRFTYDSQKRVIEEQDSVYLTHDFPVGSKVIHPAPAKYQFTNRTTYEYNDKNEVIRKTTVSGADENPTLTFSNGWSLYYQISPAYSTYSRSWTGRLLSGTTTYSYEHNADGRVISKQARFEDRKTKKVFISSFSYEYAL
ncbi:hypothetical protein [Spirosoma soli]